MGRVAVMELLKNDSQLQGFGLNADRIWPNFALDGAPRTGPFIVLRWGAMQSRFGTEGGRQDLNIWAYQPRQEGTDYALLDQILRRVTALMTATIHYVGTDGSSLVTADFEGFSEDLVDNGYDAITRNARFTVLCRQP